MFRIDPRQAVIDHITAGSPIGDTLTPAAEAAAQPTGTRYSHSVVTGIAQLVEAGLLLAVGLALIAARFDWSAAPLYIAVVIGATLAANIAFNAMRLHRVAAYRTAVDQCLKVVAGWSGVFIAILAGLTLLAGADPQARLWLVSWYAGGAIALVVFRLGLRALVVRWSAKGKLRRRTVVVGGGEEARLLIEKIKASADDDIELLGLFDDRVGERSPETVAGVHKLGRVADLIAFSRRTGVDVVIVSMPLAAESRVLEMLRQLWVLPVDIRLSAHLSRLRFTDRTYSYLGDVPVFELADRPISDWNLVLKWAFDKLVAVVALIVLSPVMIATAIAVKATSEGPILFRQKRYGFNNELIEIFKFRSMYVHLSDAAASTLVTRGDPRVTPVGRFIRRTSIDELPQLFNVLLGELSIVGPRPHALEAKAANTLYHDAVDGYFARHKVKPGITGWAQINGWRGETDTLEKIMQRVDHDIHYIENWSLFLDIYILFATPFSLLSKSENAF